jgi:thiol-disulfide isomerase/thioredoxin
VPCRREAPYLSRIQEKYGPQGLVVVAVNAYDEERQVIADFVSKEKLKQTVLLMGSKVAQDLYAAPSYPTSYWIDREGKVVRREMGFQVTMVPALERMARKLVTTKP